MLKENIKKIFFVFIFTLVGVSFISKAGAYELPSDFNTLTRIEKIKEIKIAILEIKKIILKILIERKENQNKRIPIKVYNQAYQENYEADKIEDIIKNAKDSYVLIDIDYIESVKEKISRLKYNNNIVSCYTSIGTAENWRSDFNELKKYATKKEWDDWKGEYFISINNNIVVKIMKKRIDKMLNVGCQFIEFDNMDWVDKNNIEKFNLKITEKESRKYSENLCNYVHEKNGKCMAKSTNFGNKIFDGLTVESSNINFNWWNKQEMKDILKKNKIGIVVHYNENNCNYVLNKYRKIYGKNISFICEDKNDKVYKNFL